MNIFGDFYDGLPGDAGLSRHLPPREQEVYEHPVVAKPEGQLAAEANRRRFPWFGLLLLLVVGRLGYSLTQIQVQGAAAQLILPTNNHLQEIPILPLRGVFLDNKGEALLKNTPSFSLAIIPADWPLTSAERKARFQQLADSAHVDPTIFNEIEKRWVFTLDPVIVKEDISRDDALLLEEQISRIPGVVVLKTPIRQYDGVTGLSHILGYTGRLTDAEHAAFPSYRLSDPIGKAGLEEQYEKELRGVDGKQEVEMNARGQVEQIVSTTQPTAGDNIQLYLDRDLQAKLADSLHQAIDHAQAKAGAAVAIDPRNGGIVASVSWPTYDNNLFAKGISAADYKKLISDDNNPLLNRVVAGQYPSGSTIKPFVASAALAEHVIAPDKRIVTPAEIHVGSWTFSDWKPHGSADVRQAIAESNNIFFYAVGGGYGDVQGLGIERMADYLGRFGFGKETNVDWPGESVGLVPTPEWKQKQQGETWYIGDTYNASIGQGDVLVTPLQLARGIAAIANGGTLYEPRYAKALVGPDGSKHDLPPVVANQQVVPADVVKIVQEGMRQTVTAGTARPLQDVGVPVAAKTGTAQFTAVDKDKTHAWTVAYAPADHPELVLAVVVEGGGESFDVAVPIIHDVLVWKYPKT